LKHETSNVAFVDTTGDFSPLRLRDVIVFQLKHSAKPLQFHQSGYVYEPIALDADPVANELLEKEAAQIMERVRIMRVFDFAGVVEAVDEVRNLCEQNDRKEEDRKRRLRTGLATRKPQEIADSQDEEGDNEDDGAADFDNIDQTNLASGGNQASIVGEGFGGVGMIVIDTIANVVSSMSATSQIEGQALLTKFMRVLRHLGGIYHICTLLVNSVVGLNASNTLNQQRQPEDNVSIFSSTLGKPALGKTYGYLIDTSIFLSKVPRNREDAEIAFTEGSAGSWRSVHVLEVLKDRNDAREGRWTAFDIVAGTVLKKVF